MPAIMAELSAQIHADYSALPERLTELVRQQYPFGSAEAEVGYHAEGSNNLVFLCTGVSEQVTGAEAFVMRVPKRTDGEAALEAAFTNREQMRGLPVPQALGLGRLSCCNTLVMLEEYVAGKPKEFNTLTKPEIGQLAVAVAAIHSRKKDRFSPRPGALPTQRGTYRDYILAMLEESVDERLKNIDLDEYSGARSAIARGKVVLNAFLVQHETDFSGSMFSLLHSDLNPGNILWPPKSEPKQQLKVVDIDGIFGDPADDVDYICTDSNASLEFKAALWDSYRSIVGAEEAKAVFARIPAYTLKNRLDDLAWSIDRHRRNRANPAVAEAYFADYEQRLKALRLLVRRKV